MRKNKLIVVSIVMVTMLVFNNAVFAQGTPSGVNTAQPPVSPAGVNTAQPPVSPAGVTTVQTGSFFYLQNPLNSKFNSVGGLIQGFLEIFSYVAVLFAVIMLIWTGLQFVLAQGKPDRMKELKNWLLWIVVGVAIIIGARIIVSIVINTLSASGAVDSGIIQNAKNAAGGFGPTQ